MPEIEFKVIGVEHVRENIRKFVKEADRALVLTMAKVVDKIAQDAKSFAPVDTGFLRDHISARVGREKSSVTGFVVSGARYSIYQELGTTRHGAHPFMLPAFNKNIDFIREELGNAILDSAFKAGIRQGTLVGRIR